MLEVDSNPIKVHYEFAQNIVRQSKSESDLCSHKKKNKVSEAALVSNVRSTTRKMNKNSTVEKGQDVYKENIPSENDPTRYVVINVFKQQNVSRFNGNPHTRANRDLPEYTAGAFNVFLQCVMLITLTMYMFTVILVIYVLITPDMKKFLVSHAIIAIILSLFIFLSIDYGFVCTECSRRAPCNFYFLSFTVVSISTIIATVSALLDTTLILYAIVSVMVTVLVGAFLSCTKFDFASHILYMIMLGSAFSAIALIVLVVSLVTGTFVGALWLLVLVIVTFVQVTMSTMQLQTILGGKTIQIKEDDYAIGAFMLYAAVIDLFLKALQIAGVTRDTDDNR